MKSETIIFKQPGEVVFRKTNLDAPGSDEILVRTRVTLISTGTELTMFSGKFPRKSVWDTITKYPMRPGYCNAGVVEKTGDNVHEFHCGDRVVSNAPHGELAFVNKERVMRIPRSISDEEATFGILAQTVLNGIRLGQISLGECVVIVGLGLLGQMACQFSKLSGGFPVVALDLSEKRLEVAKRLGATVALKTEKGNDVSKQILEFTKGRGADVVFEVTGNPKAIPWELNLVRSQGRIVILGSPSGKTVFDFHDHVNWPSRTIIGAHASSHPSCETPYNPWTRRRNTELFFDLVTAGLVNVKELISAIYPWKEAKKVYHKLLDPMGERLETLGILLDFR